MNNYLELDIVKEAIPRSKTAFISVKGGSAAIHFSSFLSREIGMLDGYNVAWYAKETDEELKYVWGFYITENTLNAAQLKRSRENSMFKINAKKAASLIHKAFRVQKNKTIRLYVNIKKPIVYKNGAEDVKIYMIYDMPPMREDMDEDAREEYNRDYIDKMLKVKNYGLNTD